MFILYCVRFAKKNYDIEMSGINEELQLWHALYFIQLDLFYAPEVMDCNKSQVHVPIIRCVFIF